MFRVFETGASRRILRCMDNQNHASQLLSRNSSHRSFRRWAKHLLSSLLHCQGCSADTDVVLVRLKDLEDLIEVMACEIARQSKAKGR